MSGQDADDHETFPGFKRNIPAGILHPLLHAADSHILHHPGASHPVVALVKKAAKIKSKEDINNFLDYFSLFKNAIDEANLAG